MLRVARFLRRRQTRHCRDVTRDGAHHEMIAPLRRMDMQVFRIAPVAASLMLALGSAAHATVVTATFDGYIESVGNGGPQHLNPSTLAFGDAMHGTLSYDTALATQTVADA